MKKFGGGNQVKDQPPQLCTQSLEGELQKEAQVTADRNPDEASLDQEKEICTATIVARRVISRGIVEHQRKTVVHSNLLM